MSENRSDLETRIQTLRGSMGFSKRMLPQLQGGPMGFRDMLTFCSCSKTPAIVNLERRKVYLTHSFGGFGLWLIDFAVWGCGEVDDHGRKDMS